MAHAAVVRGAVFARKSLLARRQRIAGLAASLRRREDELQPGSSIEQRDRGADLEPFDVFGQLQAAEARELAEIDLALQRIASGTYGQCQVCGEAVGALRLRAVPEARSCMGCAARL